MKSCKVVYERTGNKREQNFERELDALLEKYCMERWASGCEIDSQMRDIAYRPKKADQNS